MFYKKRIEKLSSRLDAWINEFSCKLKSMTNRILSMDEILKGHKNALSKHAGRLKRQGADIYKMYELFEKLRKEMLTRRINEERFQKRLKEEEEWTKSFKKGIALSAECSGKLLSKHKERLDEQGKGIDELQDRSIEQRKEIQKLSKNEMVGIEDINRTAKDLIEIRDVVMELAEHLGFEITTERNKDYMKRYKVSIIKLKAKTNERDNIEGTEKKNKRDTGGEAR